MKAQDRLLYTFVGERYILKIPIYQRYYSWTTRECCRLFDDVEKLASNLDVNHFLASIVRYVDSGTPAISEIVDGQQRLTTISLLILAIIRNIEHRNITAKIQPDVLMGKFIYIEEDTGIKSIKMNLIDSDNTFYTKIVNNVFEMDDINLSNISKNYNFFYERVKSIKNIDAFWNAFGRIKFVDITLEKEDDTQTIFESLNSTGMSLTEADKVKNLLLMKSDDKDRLYKQYWEKIENNVYLDDVSRFIRFFLIIQEDGRKMIKENGIYEAFKEWTTKNMNNSNEDILATLTKYSQYFSQIKNAKTTNDRINNKLEQIINKLEVGVVYPFLMQILRDMKDNKLSHEDVEQVCDIVISYLFRNIICNSTRNFNKIFGALYHDVQKTMKNHGRASDMQHFVPMLIAVLHSKNFPDDTDISKYLHDKDISKHAHYLLSSIFSNESKESLEYGELQVEHIIPQTLNAEWRKMLKDEIGGEWEKWYNNNLSTLGNLTLTGYNPEMSNKVFHHKKAIYENSNIPSNRELAKYEKFGQKEFDERFFRMTALVTQYWKYYHNSLKLQNEQSISLDNLDDACDYAEYIPMEITYEYYNDIKTEKMNSWQDCFLVIAKLADSIDVEIIKNLIAEKRTERATKTFMAYDVQGDNRLKSPQQIGSIFIETYLSPRDIIKYFARFCEKCSIDSSSIEILMKRKGE